MKHCPRCSSEISSNDKVCPRCGLPIDKMEEYKKNFTVINETEETETNEEPKISKKEKKRLAKEEKKAKKKAEKQAKKDAIENDDTQFYKFATNSGEEDPDEILETDTYFEKRKKRKKQAAKPVFDIDENGEFNIDTKDVELVGEETGKLIDQQYEQSYSIKKSRGDYVPPKLKWWEIYKLADRHFVRRKIKKEVNKASKVKPNFVKKSKLLLLCIFLGFTGAHNFYARNKRKGWTSVVTLILCVGITILAMNFEIFTKIQISVGGCAGFINVFMWISDIINIITNQYKYRIQRVKFISYMNVETRAKLGEKYIDMELYRKPWYVRFKVWLEKKKRNYQEYKRDKRQRNIDKQKRKLAELEEKNKIERDLAEYEAKEEAKLNAKNSNEVVSQETLDEIKAFEDEEDEVSSDEVETVEETVEASNDETETEQEESSQSKKKSGVNPYANKYARFNNNKKSSKKKKKKK